MDFVNRLNTWTNFSQKKIHKWPNHQPLRKCKLKPQWGTSLVVQWLRICLPMQGTWVRSLVQEDPTCCGATKPIHHNFWACALEPTSHNYWVCAPQLLKPAPSRARVLQLLSLHAATTEAHMPRARAPQQEKPPQLEKAHVQQPRPNATKNK